MPLPQQIEIPEISSGEVEALDAALASRRPVIIRQMAKAWPALERWTQASLTERLGELVLPAHEGVSGAFPDPLGMRTRKVRFADYLESLWSGTMARPALLDGDSALIFAGRESRDENFAPLEADIELPAFIERDKLRQIGFWLSCRGVSSWLHYDNNLMDNINVQVKGSKKVTLFAPEEAPRLSLHSYVVDGVDRAQFSKIDLREPDLDRFPALKDAQAWVGTIHQGDTVFIPSCWFHGFSHLGEININVNFWWQLAAIPWNTITIRKSLWNSVVGALGAENGSPSKASIAAAVRGLSPEACSLLESLEQATLAGGKAGHP